MIRELYKTVIRETSINASQSRIDSIRKKNISRSGCRVYADGLIGIAGTLGEATEETWAAAADNLALAIPYPFEPEKDSRRVRDLRGPQINDGTFIQFVEDLLAELRGRFPQFVFSNQISLQETETALSNDAGLSYLNYDRTVQVALLVKHKNSINIFDTAIMRQSRELAPALILQEAVEMLSAFDQAMQLPEQDKILVAISPDALLGQIVKSMNGESLRLGASLFSGKMNTKAFSESFSVLQDRTAEFMHLPFFDTEGVVNPQDQCLLINRGFLEKAYTDKKNAAMIGLPSTGAASGAYDDAPALGYASLSILPGSQTLKELLRGEQAMLVMLASGGDYTNQGDYASPVQLSMLTDGEHLLGRLPECSIKGNLFDIFRADFVGISSDKPFAGERALVVRMTVLRG